MFHLQEYFPDVSLDAYIVSREYLAHQVSLEAYELQDIIISVYNINRSGSHIKTKFIV